MNENGLLYDIDIDVNSEINDIEHGWDLTKNNIDKKHNALSGYFSNSTEIKENRHKYFKFRHSLIDKRYYYQSMSNRLSKILNKHRENQKHKLQLLINSGDNQKPTNQKQRDDFVNRGTSDIVYLISQIDLMIDYLNDNIKSADHMLFAISSISKYQNMYGND